MNPVTALRYSPGMNEPPEHDERAGGVGAVPDRRRPGRVTYRDPHLIALLRRQWQRPEASAPENPAANGDTDQGLDQDHCDDLAAARGIVTAGLISLAMILAVIAAVLLL